MAQPFRGGESAPRGLPRIALLTRGDRQWRPRPPIDIVRAGGDLASALDCSYYFCFAFFFLRFLYFDPTKALFFLAPLTYGDGEGVHLNAFTIGCADKQDDLRVVAWRLELIRAERRVSDRKDTVACGRVRACPLSISSA